MMIGLPASGKTEWVKKHIQENSDKKYNIIGNSQLLERMTVSRIFENIAKCPFNNVKLLIVI